MMKFVFELENIQKHIKHNKLKNVSKRKHLGFKIIEDFAAHIGFLNFFLLLFQFLNSRMAMETKYQSSLRNVMIDLRIS